jgi:hypothetical protein
MGAGRQMDGGHRDCANTVVFTRQGDEKKETDTKHDMFNKCNNQTTQPAEAKLLKAETKVL